jgi:hypothetical protein
MGNFFADEGNRMAFGIDDSKQTLRRAAATVPVVQLVVDGLALDTFGTEEFAAAIRASGLRNPSRSDGRPVFIPLIPIFHSRQLWDWERQSVMILSAQFEKWHGRECHGRAGAFLHTKNTG